MTESNTEMIDDLLKFKVMVVGDQGTGKSCILNRFVNDKFDEQYQATIGLDFHSKNVEINGHDIRLILYDTAGQEKFRSLIPMYIREAQVILLIYDISNMESFNSINKWFTDVLDVKSTEAVYVLIGNKTDLESERKISSEQGQYLANEKNMIFSEVSAKTGSGFNELFEQKIYPMIYKTFKLEFDRREIIEGQEEDNEAEEGEGQETPNEVGGNKIKLDSNISGKAVKKKKKCC